LPAAGTDAAEDHRAKALRTARQEPHRDASAHRIAHHVGALDPQARHEVRRVARHPIGTIVGGSVEFLALPVAAVVERDDPAPGITERLHPARIDPVDAMVRGEAMDQEDRLAAVVALRRDVDESDVDAIGRKMPKHGCRTRPVRAT